MDNTFYDCDDDAALLTISSNTLGHNADSARGLCQEARLLAYTAHQGQVDKAGQPYVHHPREVAGRIRKAGGSPDAVAAGWLHDVVEDTWVTLDYLADAGFPATVINAVDAVTKRAGEPTEEYVHRIVADPIAVMVKRADLADNTDPDRLALLDPLTRARLEAKYAAFTTALEKALGSLAGFGSL